MFDRFRPSCLALSVSLASGSVWATDHVISSNSTSMIDDTTINANDSLTLSSGITLNVAGSDAIYLTNDNITLHIYGAVTGRNDGIDVDEANTITVYSGGSVTAGLQDGIRVDNNGNTVDIYGTVTGVLDGIQANDGNQIVVRSGGTVSGDDGIDANDGNQIVVHSGGTVTGRLEAIEVDVANTVTVYSGGRVTSTTRDGIWLNGDGNVAHLYGTVSGADDGIEIDGSTSNVGIYGLVDGASNSVYVDDGTSNTVTIGENARLIGGVTTDTAGNTLKFDVGSALSYVYDTTGSWTLEDLDGRSVVAGSAMAAGIGNAETADELQYLRLSQINHSLLNRADRYALVDGERQAWADPFYFNSERDASRTDATIEDYDADGYGLTIGLPIALKGLDADVILGVQETALDIHSGAQNIDVSSLRAGLYFPNLLTQDAIRVSGKALIGYNQHDMDRQVLVNSNTTTGITTYTADYDSWEAVAGLEAEHSQPLGTGATTLTASLGADLIYEAIESYDETANFHWDSRDLLQGVAKASLGLHHVHTNGMKTYAIASVQARDVFDGKTTDYAINGTAVNFSGGDFNDTITQLNLGATYQAKDNLQLGLNLQAARSDNDIDSYAASARLNWTF